MKSIFVMAVLFAFCGIGILFFALGSTGAVLLGGLYYCVFYFLRILVDAALELL